MVRYSVVTSKGTKESNAGDQYILAYECGEHFSVLQYSAVQIRVGQYSEV